MVFGFKGLKGCVGFTNLLFRDSQGSVRVLRILGYETQTLKYTKKPLKPKTLNPKTRAPEGSASGTVHQVIHICCCSATRTVEYGGYSKHE